MTDVFVVVFFLYSKMYDLYTLADVICAWTHRCSVCPKIFCKTGTPHAPYLRMVEITTAPRLNNIFNTEGPHAMSLVYGHVVDYKQKSSFT